MRPLPRNDVLLFYSDNSRPTVRPKLGRVIRDGTWTARW
jgi:hypothetical protein